MIGRIVAWVLGEPATPILDATHQHGPVEQTDGTLTIPHDRFRDAA